MRTVLRPTWIIDGTGSPAFTDHAVALVEGLIDAVIPIPELDARDDDLVIDLPGTTLIPGLINNHVHLVLPGDNTPFVPWIDTQSDAALALRAAHNAETSLRTGVTTVRDCGGRGSTVLDLREAQVNGLANGARVISCGWPLTITGGHTRHFGGEVDGEDSIRTMVRKVVGLGADYVKVMAAGGGTPGSLPQYPSFTVRELRVIVETAHDLGRLVAAHCIATASIENAVEAGVDLIEHASFFGPELILRFDARVAEKLARAGIPVTPTLQVNRDLADLLPDGPERTRWALRQQAQREIIGALRDLGVPLLAGSDAGWRATAFDTFWKELDELVECGLSAEAAIHVATGAVSRALGVEDRYGTIRPGQIADLVAIEGQVGVNIRCLREVRGVLQTGKVVYPDRLPG
ncbi:MAG: amidohydrolase family protein [Chloroflexota bacterium]|nr:amidohydrolase family protein [Chloroflexota bacterium]